MVFCKPIINHLESIIKETLDSAAALNLIKKYLVLFVIAI